MKMEEILVCCIVFLIPHVIVTRISQVAGWKQVGNSVNLNSPTENALQTLASRSSKTGFVLEKIHSVNQHDLGKYRQEMDDLLEFLLE